MGSDETDRTKEELLDEILGDLDRDDLARDGLLSVPPTEEVVAAVGGEEHHGGAAPMPPVGDAGHEHMDHERMVFEMVRRDESGQVVRVDPKDIPRDTSDYDEDGNDPGTGPPPMERGAAEPGHEHGGHGHGG